jgi:hypothetical protein
LGYNADPYIEDIWGNNSFAIGKDLILINVKVIFVYTHKLYLAADHDHHVLAKVLKLNCGY